jgi:8-oxo-dGTP pyrophosphatase MutT (NUDIX family)
MIDHASQVSLPGGAVEPGETAPQAAIREFHEELGDDGQPLRLLGILSPHYVQASNYLVAPCVAAAPARPRFVPNPAEVAEVLEVPLSHLLDPAHFGSHVRQHEGHTYSAPHFLFQSYRIWGATCMILGELVTVLEEMRNLNP